MGKYKKKALSIGGAIVGGTIGFITGGPAGAIRGAALGYTLGRSLAGVGKQPDTGGGPEAYVDTGQLATAVGEDAYVPKAYGYRRCGSVLVATDVQVGINDNSTPIPSTQPQQTLTGRTILARALPAYSTIVSDNPTRYRNVENNASGNFATSVYVLGEGPWERIVNVYYANNPIFKSTAQLQFGVVYSFGDDVFDTTQKFNNLQFEFVRGELNQSRATLLSNVYNADGTSWFEPTDIGTGICYMVVRIKRDINAIIKETSPSFTVDAYAKRIKEIRRQGSPIQYNDSIYQTATNPSLIALDQLRDPLFGLGLNDTDIDFDSFVNFANYCDSPGTYSDGNSVPPFRMHGQFRQGSTTKEILEQVALCTGALFTDENGIVTVKIDKDEFTETAPIINVNNIVGDLVRVEPKTSELPNVINVKYINQQGIEVIDVVEFNSTVINAEGRKEADLDLRMVQDKPLALELAKRVLYQNRQPTLEFKMNTVGYNLDIYGVAKVQNIFDTNIVADGTRIRIYNIQKDRASNEDSNKPPISVSAKIYNSQIYSVNPTGSNSAINYIPSTSILSTSGGVSNIPAPINVSVTKVSDVELSVSWSHLAIYTAEILYRVNGSTSDYILLTTTNSSPTSVNLLSSGEYQIAVRYVSGPSTIVLYDNDGLPVETTDKGVITDGTVFVESQHKYLQIRYADDSIGSGIRAVVTKQNEIQTGTHSDGATSNPVQIEVNTSTGYTQSEVIKIPSDFNAGTPELEQHTFFVNGDRSNVLRTTDEGGINTNYIDVPKDSSTPYETWKTCINSLSYNELGIDRPDGGVQSGTFQLIYSQNQEPFNSVLAAIETSSRDVNTVVRRLVHQFNNVLNGVVPTGVPAFTLLNDFENKRLLFVYKDQASVLYPEHSMRFYAFGNNTTIENGNKTVFRYPDVSINAGEQYLILSGEPSSQASGGSRISVTKSPSPQANAHDPSTGRIIKPVPTNPNNIINTNLITNLGYTSLANGYWEAANNTLREQRNTFYSSIKNNTNVDQFQLFKNEFDNNLFSKTYYLATSPENITDAGRITSINFGNSSNIGEYNRPLEISLFTATISNTSSYGVLNYTTSKNLESVNDTVVSGNIYHDYNYNIAGYDFKSYQLGFGGDYSFYYFKAYNEDWSINPINVNPVTARGSAQHLAYCDRRAVELQQNDLDPAPWKNSAFVDLFTDSSTGLLWNDTKLTSGSKTFADYIEAVQPRYIKSIFDQFYQYMNTVSNNQYSGGSRGTTSSNWHPDSTAQTYDRYNVEIPNLYARIDGKEFKVTISYLNDTNLLYRPGYRFYFSPVISDGIDYLTSTSTVNLNGRSATFYLKDNVYRRNSITVSNRDLFVSQNSEAFSLTNVDNDILISNIQSSVRSTSVLRSSNPPIDYYGKFNIYSVNDVSTIQSNYIDQVSNVVNTNVNINTNSNLTNVLQTLTEQLNNSATNNTSFSVSTIPNDATGELQSFRGQQAIKVTGGTDRYNVNINNGSGSGTLNVATANPYTSYYRLPGVPKRQTRMTIWYENIYDSVSSVPLQYNGYILDLEIPYKTSNVPYSNAQQIANYIATVFENYMGTNDITATVTETANSWRVSITRPQTDDVIHPQFGKLALFDGLIVPPVNIGEQAYFEPTYGRFTTPPVYAGLPTEYTIFSPNDTYTHSFTKFVSFYTGTDITNVVNEIVTFINNNTNNEWTANFSTSTRRLIITHASSSDTGGNWRIQVNNQFDDLNLRYGNISFNDIGNPPEYEGFGIFVYPSEIPIHVLYTKRFTFNYSQGQFVNKELPTNLSKTFTANANQSIAEANIDSFFTDNSITVTKTKYSSLQNILIYFPEVLGFGSNGVNFIQIPPAIAPKFINTYAFYYRTGTADGYTGNIYWSKINDVDYYIWNRNSIDPDGGWIMASKNVTLPYFYFPTLNGSKNYTVAQQNRFIKVNAGVNASSATSTDITEYTLSPNPVISNTLDILINYNFGIQDSCNTIFGWDNTNNSSGTGISSYTEKGFIGTIITGGNATAPQKTRFTLREPDNTIIIAKDYWNYSTSVPGHTNRTLAQILTDLGSYLNTNKGWTTSDNGTLYTVTIPYGNVGIPILKSGALKWDISSVNPIGTYTPSLNPGNIVLTSPFNIVQEGGPVPVYYGLRSQSNNTFLNSSDPNNFKWLKIPGLVWQVGDANVLNGSGTIMNTLNPSYKLFVRQRPQFDFITPSPYQNGYQAIDPTTWIIDTDDLTINQVSTIATVNPGKNTNTLTGSISIYQASNNRFLIARDVDSIGDIPTNANALTGNTIYISHENTINSSGRTVVNITDNSTNYEPTRFYTYTANNTTWTEI